MNLTRIIKIEYFEKTLIFDLEELKFIIIDDTETIFGFNSREITVTKHENDVGSDLRRISLDIYSVWKRYTENMEFINRIIE